MHCFMMKARTLDGAWVEFDLCDAPTRYNETEFALLNRPNTPRLRLDVVRRGVRAFELFEGDIFESEGTKWLVCYERGFYAINEDYVTRMLDTFKWHTIVGDCFSSEFKVPISMRNKHLFKYKNTIFRIEDILGAYDKEHLLLRCFSDPVPVVDIQQYCGIVLEGTKAFFGDAYKQGVLTLYKGRLAYNANNEYTDVITGGKF